MWCGIKRGWDDRREKPIALSKAKQYGLLLSEFVDYDAGIRTNRGASGTTDAGFGVYVLAECIAVVIDGGGAECKRLRGASHYARLQPLHASVSMTTAPLIFAISLCL